MDSEVCNCILTIFCIKYAFVHLAFVRYVNCIYAWFDKLIAIYSLYVDVRLIRNVKLWHLEFYINLMTIFTLKSV